MNDDEADRLNVTEPPGTSALGGDDVLSLASLLDGFPDPAILISNEHEIIASNEAYRRQFEGGEKVRGKSCFEVSHNFTLPCNEVGESCPLRVSRETGEHARVVHVHHTQEGREFEEVNIYPVRGEGEKIQRFLEILRPAAVATPRSSATQLVGRSRAFCRMLDMALRVAPRKTTVLLLGESGTGKELLAKAVHSASPRKDEKFVPVDCSGLSETLFESELFGHERGAFTGATNRKVGLVEEANGGTLFLDEVGDIPPPLQVKLLRLVETGLFRRVGATDLRSSDFRLVCATHRNLEAMVEREKFRRDLYYRISAFPIRLPPLRERREDIPVLTRSLGKRLGCSAALNLSPEALEALDRYAFPGNIRELLNILERACLLSDGGKILPEYFPEAVTGGSTSTDLTAMTDEVVSLEVAEKRYLRWAVSAFEGSKKELAQQLGISERTLYRKLNGGG
jgi:transcriptional regulator with PAS, ATPase and Fis domain